MRDEDVGEAEIDLRSMSRLRICDWIDTSSAETGSSSTTSFGSQRNRPGNADALALAAGKFMRVAPASIGVEANQLREAPAPWPCARRAADAMDMERLGDDGPTVMRGSSEAYGSWNTICMSRRRRCKADALSVDRVSPAKTISPEVGSIRRRSNRARVDFPQPEFADDAKDSALRKVQTDPVDRLHHALAVTRREMLAEPLNLDQCRHGIGFQQAAEWPSDMIVKGGTSRRSVQRRAGSVKRSCNDCRALRAAARRPEW